MLGAGILAELLSAYVRLPRMLILLALGAVLALAVAGVVLSGQCSSPACCPTNAARGHALS